MALVAGTSTRRQDADVDQDSEAEVSQQFQCFGRFRTQVVGVRYYNGHVNMHEMVVLVREPTNIYDRWAVRVDNVRGEKVGHLKKEQVCHLSPLMDQGLLRIEGLAAGKKGVYVMPVDIYCFGPHEAMPTVERRLRAVGISLEAVDPLNPTGDIGADASLAKMSQSEMDNNLDRMFDEILASGGPVEMMSPNSEVLSQMYPHQRAALAWMVKRENSSQLPPFWEPKLQGGALAYLNSLTNFLVNERPAPMRGGILADDMGLGKTLVVLSLIATNRPGAALPPVHVANPDGSPVDNAPAGKRRKTSKPKAGAADGGGPSSGPMLSQMVTQATAKPKGKAAQLAAAEEPPHQLPRLGGPTATLIVCPLSVLSNWQTQVDEHTAGNLKVYIYHGPNRQYSAAVLSQHDIVLTTYATLSSDACISNGIMAVNWLRVVLDEAHNVKNPNAQQSQAVQRLKAERRWAVTGTPIQNKLQDVYGLMAFLKLEPLDQRSLFTRALERPIKAQDVRGFKKLQVLMASIVIRRTKDMQINGRPLVLLPRKTVNIKHVMLTAEDRLKYDRLEHEGMRIVSGYLTSNSILENYMSVLEIILRLRQVCDAGVLCPEGRLQEVASPPTASSEGKGAASAASSPELLQKLLAHLQAAGDEECPICLSPIELPCITLCAHMFCRRCIEATLMRDKPQCPMCRHAINVADIIDAPKPTEAAEADMDEAVTGSGATAAMHQSAKVAALISHLLAVKEKKVPAGEPPFKSVVFSQFVGMMNLVQQALKQAGANFVRMDGSTIPKKRADILRAFADRSPNSPTVFLVSLKAGGVGMNLTAANEVHLLDPWWNPSVEEQAMDRVHRLGQTRDVEVFRYIAEGTIEERMMELQERKRALAGMAFDKRSVEQNRQMRIDDVKLLMRL